MAEKTYIAKEDIFFGTARAHNAGDVVPAENVKANGWEHLVVTEGTKAAKEARESAGEQYPAQAPVNP